MERSVRTEKEVKKAARERSGAVEDAMRLLASQFFSRPHALLCTNSRFMANDDKVLETNTIKQLQFTAPALPFVFALLLQGVSEPRHMQQPAVKRPQVMEPDDKENSVRPPAAYSDVLLSPEDR